MPGPFNRPVPQTDNMLLGIGLALIGTSMLPLTDSIIKYLGAALPILVILWARTLLQLVLLLMVVGFSRGLASLRHVFTPVHLARAALLFAAMMCYFVALKTLPLADAIALGFNYPLVMTMLAPLVLGEKVGLRRWLAVLVGLIGAMIIIRPGFREGATGSWLALSSGILFAMHLLLTRKVARSTPAELTLVFTALFVFAATSLAMPFVWVTPSADHWLWLLLAGIMVSIASYCLVRAYQYAPASVLAVFGYSELLFAVMAGLVFFGDFPDAMTFLGAAIIAASGIYISIREYTSRSAP